MLFPLSLTPTLPTYGGAYNVGSAEYEVPVSALTPEIDSPPVSTIRFRLFYPTSESGALPSEVLWLPEPQDIHLDAYLKLAKIGRWTSALIRTLPWWLRTTTIPVYRDASPLVQETPFNVLVFSHGLVGGMNVHSATLGELASHGMLCVAVEHRDGSAPVTLVRNKDGSSPIYFRNISFKIRPGVLEARDEQIRTRLFELMATYKALEMLNRGESLANLAVGGPSLPSGCLNLKPGCVSWAGHSFGGATMIQFIKSIFYSEHSPPGSSSSLLISTPSSSLLEQIGSSSPLTLLDPWYLPLKSQTMKWLYSKPLPCHASTSDKAGTTCTVLSSEFAWYWPECHSHMPAILSSNPDSIEIETQEAYDAILLKYKTPKDFMREAKRDEVRFQTLLASLRQVATPRTEIYVLRETTHTTLTDFGVLFPWISYLLAGQKDPLSATQNVVRCILKAAGINGAWDTVPIDNSAANAQLEQIA